MKRISILLVSAAALTALAACDRSGGNDAVAVNAAAPANATDTNSAGAKDPATNSAAPAAGSAQLSRQYLIGRWTDNGDCNNTITFAADGSFTVPGGGSGLWVLDGDQLTFQGSSTRTARVQATDANTIMLTHPDGSIGRSTRCTN